MINHEIVIWDNNSKCYRKYDEHDFTIDGKMLDEHDREIYSKALDDAIEIVESSKNYSLPIKEGYATVGFKPLDAETIDRIIKMLSKGSKND